MKRLTFLLMAFICNQKTFSQIYKSNHLKPLKMDGCTFFIDGTKSSPKAWLHCCNMHDIEYWAGGTKQDQLDSDNRLSECVRKSGHNIYSKIMYLGVRLGHYSPIKNKMKWGWGWNNKAEFFIRSKEDDQLIKLQIKLQKK
jgi:hypothetical protein